MRFGGVTTSCRAVDNRICRFGELNQTFGFKTTDSFFFFNVVTQLLGRSTKFQDLCSNPALEALFRPGEVSRSSFSIFENDVIFVAKQDVWQEKMWKMFVYSSLKAGGFAH